jgi:hypothetical protein
MAVQDDPFAVPVEELGQGSLLEAREQSREGQENPFTTLYLPANISSLDDDGITRMVNTGDIDSDKSGYEYIVKYTTGVVKPIAPTGFTNYIVHTIGETAGDSTTFHIYWKQESKKGKQEGGSLKPRRRTPRRTPRRKQRGGKRGTGKRRK